MCEKKGGDERGQMDRFRYSGAYPVVVFSCHAGKIWVNENSLAPWVFLVFFLIATIFLFKCHYPLFLLFLWYVRSYFNFSFYLDKPYTRLSVSPRVSLLWNFNSLQSKASEPDVDRAWQRCGKDSIDSDGLERWHIWMHVCETERDKDTRSCFSMWRLFCTVMWQLFVMSFD